MATVETKTKSYTAKEILSLQTSQDCKKSNNLGNLKKFLVCSYANDSNPKVLVTF